MNWNETARWALGGTILLVILFIRELTGVGYLGISDRPATPAGDIEWASLLLSWLLVMGVFAGLALVGRFLRRRGQARRRDKRSLMDGRRRTVRGGRVEQRGDPSVREP